MTSIEHTDTVPETSRAAALRETIAAAQAQLAGIHLTSQRAQDAADHVATSLARAAAWIAQLHDALAHDVLTDEIEHVHAEQERLATRETQLAEQLAALTAAPPTEPDPAGQLEPATRRRMGTPELTSEELHARTVAHFRYDNRVRGWARQAHIPVGERGAISTEVIESYLAAHPDAITEIKVG